MAKNKKIKIILVDDIEMIRKGVFYLLKDIDEIEILGEAHNGEEMLEKYFELRPDVVVMDVYMPIINGLKATEILCKRDKNARVLLFSVSDNKMETYQAYKSGAYGLVNKNCGLENFLHAINSVYDKEMYFLENAPIEKVEELVEKYDVICDENYNEDIKKLTARETEVLSFIACGYTNKQIAKELHISISTVEYHRKNIKKKLQVSSNTELMNYAINNLNLA